MWRFSILGVVGNNCRQTLAIGREILVSENTIGPNACIAPDPRRSHGEGVPLDSIFDRHDSTVRCAEEQLTAIMRPARRIGAACRNLPLSTRTGKRTHIDLRFT